MKREVIKTQWHTCYGICPFSVSDVPDQISEDLRQRGICQVRHYADFASDRYGHIRMYHLCGGQALAVTSEVC